MSEQNIKEIYNAIPEENKMKKYIDLRNITINNQEDLANVCQIFRNPKYETFRIIYMKNNRIVNYESITSRLPNQCKVWRKNATTAHLRNIKEIEDVSRRMYRLGANGYYIMHNHPSGDAKASLEDLNVTRFFEKKITGFMGHVIIDHGTYAWIDRDFLTGKLMVHNRKRIEGLPDINTDQMIRESPLINNIVSSRNELARIMYDIKHSNHYSVLILTNVKNSIRLIQEVPNTFINMSYRQIGGYIKNRCLDTGSIRAFVGTTDKHFFDRSSELANLGYLTDCIAYTLNKDKAEIVEYCNNKVHCQNILQTFEDEKENKNKEMIER